MSDTSKATRIRKGEASETAASDDAPVSTRRVAFSGDFDRVADAFGLPTGEFAVVSSGRTAQITSEFIAAVMRRDSDNAGHRRARETTAELKAIAAMKSVENPVDATEKLPRGPHDIPRDQVELTQRRRVLRAMAEVVGELGYKNTAVADVIKRAGISRATFYALYPDKESCYFDALDTLTQSMFASFVQEVVTPVELLGLTGKPRFERALDQLSIFLPDHVAKFADNPKLAKLYLVDSFAVGKRAMELKLESVRACSSLLAVALYGEDGHTPRREEDVNYLMQGFYSRLAHHFGADLTSDLTIASEQFVRMLRVLGERAFEG